MKIRDWIEEKYSKIKIQDKKCKKMLELLKDVAITCGFLCLAYYGSSILLNHTGAENNSALVFALAVALISLLTTGYSYGIVASLIGAFFTNYYFMPPYAHFSLSRVGYPVATLSMLAISCVICVLTARVKEQKEDAVRKERNTKLLYEMNERLNREKAEIQLQSDREKIRSNILRAVSHDLRTPLTSISGAAAVLMGAEELSAPNAAMIKDIKEDADNLIIMVENLLSVTRIRDGSLVLKKREEMMEEVAGDAVLTTHRRFPECRVEMELSEELLYLPMDPVLIKQVIVNLLENAIRHSGDKEHICLHLYRKEEWAVVEVMDRGKGLSEQVCQAVKQEKSVPRDVTGDTTRGMGIGLSVCQSIVRAHGGFLEAENRPDGGAVVRFGLPVE